jgi:antitoxin FitA
MQPNMPNITIKNIPDRLYQKIKETSQQNRRSINAEVIVCLEEKLLGSNSSNISLDQIRRTRSLTQRHLLTESEISDLKLGRRV